MKKTPDRLKTQIDFTALRGSEKMQIIYTALNHYNRGSQTGLTASELIIEAFKHYDPSLPEDVLELLDLKNKSHTFIDRYEIAAKEEIVIAAKTKDAKGATNLDEMKKKFFNFNTEDPKTEELWEILEIIRFRDRAAILSKMLYQYFAQGNCPFYNDFCADRLLAWLKEEAVLSEKTSEDRLRYVAEIIWDNGRNKDAIVETVEKTASPDSGDRLRKAMGIL